VRVYENRQLPRRSSAQHAPAPDDQVLPMLAIGRVDPAAWPWSGQDGTAGRGGGGDGTGRASIVRDDPQTVEVAVEADAPGFLFLADQYAAGWTAEVDGTLGEILRANHAFRLVAVPGGRSQVVFRYRPTSLWIGAAISLATAWWWCVSTAARATDRIASPSRRPASP
jgi:hypothetical protein